jgi:hypothetical protein
MATVVAQGQLTIVDANDARQITAFITASNGLQQTYTKDESLQVYLPDYTTSNNVLTANVLVAGSGGVQDITSLLTNKKWSNDRVTSLGSGLTLTINANLDPANPQKTYYFEADFVDPMTTLTLKVLAQISLSLVKTGTNAVYIVVRGTTSIKDSNTATKNVAIVVADLMRAAGVDTTGVTYKFYDANGATQIYNTSPFTTKYGLKTTAAGATPAGSASDIGVNLPASGAWSNYNTLIIHESAVAGVGVFRVEAKDADGTVYSWTFTVYDSSDPYQLLIVSTNGDKLQNGAGSTLMYPLVYNGAALLSVADTSSWSFKWTINDKNGNLCGFVDTTRTAVAGGRDVTANTVGPAAAVTYSGANISLSAGDMIKLFNPTTGDARFYEAASSTTNVVTLRVATVSTFLNTPWPAGSITASQFVGWKMFVCKGTGSTAGTQTTTGSQSGNFITVTGDEVDGKANVFCEASRP